MPVPLYTPDKASGAYQLRFSWTGWPSEKLFRHQPVELIDATRPAWETDGLRVLEYRWTSEMVQILFSTLPTASPVFLAGRAKGRLDHALRQAGLKMEFSRKVAVRSIGDNTRSEVEAYVANQVANAHFADTDFAETLAEFTVLNPAVDLSQPSDSARGRYWYNLHLVLVTEDRSLTSDRATLRTIRDGCLQIANKKEHLLARLAVMPDHLHVALRPSIQESPLDVVFAYQNNLAFLLGQKRLWRDGYYVGTCSEYTTQAVRKVAQRARE